MVRRIVGLGAVVAAVLFAAGCGGGGGRGKNKDYDRPTSAETKK